MENKSLFTSITLVIVIVVGYFLHNEQVDKLQAEIDIITAEYNAKLSSIQTDTKLDSMQTDTKLDSMQTDTKLDSMQTDTKLDSMQTDTKLDSIQTDTKNAKTRIIDKPIVNSANISALEDLNNQLINAHSEIKSMQKKLSLATSKSGVLTNEISQMSDSRNEVKLLTKSLKSAEQKLTTTQQELSLSDDKVKYLQGIFETKNKETIVKNIARIKTLKEASSGIAVTGIIAPVIGLVTLVAYATEEIDNYCVNIKNTINLEKDIFGKVVSLDPQMQKDFHYQCDS